MIRLTISVILLCFYYTVFCQDTDSTANEKENILDRIQIRKSFDSKHEKGEAATINMVFPQDTSKNSYNLNLAVGINLFSENSLLSLSPTYDIKKNTLISKEQDVRKYGIASGWDILDLYDKKWTPNLYGKANFKNDKIKESKSFESMIYLTFFFTGSKGKVFNFFVPESVTDFKILYFNYNPYVGLEYENKYETNIEVKESMVRFYFRFQSSLLLLPNQLDDKLKFEYNYYLRHDSKKSENYDSQSHPLNKLSLEYKFSNIGEKGSASIGAEYTNGENPSDGFEKQEFYSIVLKFKY